MMGHFTIAETSLPRECRTCRIPKVAFQSTCMSKTVERTNTRTGEWLHVVEFPVLEGLVLALEDTVCEVLNIEDFEDE